MGASVELVRPNGFMRVDLGHTAALNSAGGVALSFGLGAYAENFRLSAGGRQSVLILYRS